MLPSTFSASFDLLDIGGDEESELPGSTCGGSHGPSRQMSSSASSSSSSFSTDLEPDVGIAGKVTTPQVPQVLVIGAGVSGLRAASKLKASGVNVKVVEARGRLGGRIFTSRTVGKPPREIGAAWAHETSQNQLVPLIPKLGIEYYFDDGAPLYYTKEGLAGSQFKAKKVADEFADYCEYYYEKNPTAEDKPCQEFIKEYVEQHPMLSEEEKKWAPEAFRECELWQGINSDYASSKHLSYFITERNAYVTGGYDKLVEYIAEPLVEDIMFHTTVRKIEHNGSVVTLQCESGTRPFTLEADAVIVTVPLGVLKQRMLQFDPPLGGRFETAVDKYSYTALGKVFFEFDRVFWSTENDQMVYYPDSSLEKESVLAHAFVINNLWTVCGNMELCIQTASPLTQRLEAMTESQLAEFFTPLFQLIKRDSEPLPKCLSVETTKWTQDKFAGYGTYSALQVSDDPELFMQYLHDNKQSRVQFAGEHCTMVGNGCVHGAFESGDVAADNLIYSLDMCRAPLSPFTSASSLSSSPWPPSLGESD